jgi:hypothetical protein
MKSILEKCTTTIDIVDADVDLLTPIATLVTIDIARLEREVLKQSIADKDVQKFLPFNTRLVAGTNHFHIQNISGYAVETDHHIITEGETLCKRAGRVDLLDTNTWAAASCPGCLAKGKAIIVNHLLAQEVR